MRESEYRDNTPLHHRKEYGQFFTPAPVARLMAQWILRANPKTILDPAFGLGIFYDEIIKTNSGTPLSFTGYEIDSHIMTYLSHTGKHKNLRLIQQDYLCSDTGYFDGIICNPPYMRFQKFLNRHHVLAKLEEKTGKKLAGYANTASVFLVKSLTELNRNGNLAFIMPFEFFNTGYGKDVKKSLLENHLLKQIIIFSNEKEIFPDATTTVCVLLCRNDGKEEAIKIAHIKSNEEIESISDVSHFFQREIRHSDLPYSKKWTPILLSLFSEHKQPDGFCKLSAYGAFTRGIATGANEFFALTKSKIKAYGLDNDNCFKCITKSAQIRKSVFTEADFDRLCHADKAVFCLDVKDHSKLEIQNYIRYGEKQGFNERYLTKMRNPWYRMEHRKPAPILFGVFSRGRLKVIRNFTTAINFTCFHCFYPNLFGEQLINRLFVYFISDLGQNILKNSKRSYGDELDKFEPNDLNESLCPSPAQFELMDEEDARSVIDMAITDEEKAVCMSNVLTEKIFNTGFGSISGAIHIKIW
ncbi:MAG: class I SAM-dependent DNA methyltransferase [Desulfococcaceae bacterium]